MTYSHVLDEVNQGHRVRKHLYEKLEKTLGAKKQVVAFFTSFVFPVMLQDQDADMLEEVLHNSRLASGVELVLLLNSPGGEALPAERIVNICRSFSGNNFSVIVPKMAKSAATMVCFGANRIGMCKTSELGPIDPQIPIEDERGRVTKYLAAHEIIESYKELMTKANKTRGRLEPFLQQLARFDARDIRRIVSAQQLSESIAVTCLHSGVLSGSTPREIKSKIKPFLDPKYTKVHGRPIYHDLAKKCGLTIDLYELGSPVWQVVWQLYVRLNHVVSSHDFHIAKVVESAEDSYTAPLPYLPPFAMMDSDARGER